jgi:hypothetical protein
MTRTLTTPAPLYVAATYRGVDRGWVPMGEPRPLAQAQALAALAARIRTDVITQARAAGAPSPRPLSVSSEPRRWHPQDTADTWHALRVIGATYGAVIIALGAFSLATGSHRWATPATPAPVALSRPAA